jgi:oligoendopeptidase F
VRREDKAHLRTRVGSDGMDYKGYNIAVHELGHNIEQVFSLNAIDSWWLNGVPNTGFTEALAFVFQNRDLELLGVAMDDKDSRRLEALDTLWNTAEIAAVALLDMRVWRFMYAHPEATPAELREATVTMAREVWNRYLAPVIGVEDSEILAIYSHMIAYGLYLPDYPLGHIIAFQVAEKMNEGNLGAEFERLSRQGRLTPDAWMRGAVGRPLSTEALLREARTALDTLAKKS